MFSHLYNSVFPAMGQFFGLFAHLAQMTFGDFSRAFLVFPTSSEVTAFEFLNLFNGSTHSFYSPLAALYAGLQPLTDLPSWIQGFLTIPHYVVFRVLHLLTDSIFNNAFIPLLESVGMSSATPTWLAMLMLSPFYAIGIGFLKHVFDGLPWL